MLQEEALKSEEICINVYHEINMVDLTRCKNRKLSELDGSNMEVIKYVIEKVRGKGLVQLCNDMWSIVRLPE
jgi:hypothetical protein